MNQNIQMGNNGLKITENDLKQLQHHSQQSQKYKALFQRKRFYAKQDEYLSYVMCDINYYFKEQLLYKLSPKALNQFSIITNNDKDRLRFQSMFDFMKCQNKFLPQLLKIKSVQENRGIASILGMAIGDALGASTQFIPYNKEGLKLIKNGFKDIHENILHEKLIPRHGEIGVWTDDAAMGLCLIDSLLLNDYKFNPKHMRYLFILWLHHGLNNGGRQKSIGLGSNIAISMQQFLKYPQNYTSPGDKFNSGNGSLMRLAPIPVAFRNDQKNGIQYAGLHSLTTHNGDQARQCCRLMAQIIIELINRKQQVDGKAVIENICNKFKSEVESVEFLARGQMQTKQLYEQACKKNKNFKKFNKKIQDRNWNWKSKQFTYSPCRIKARAGYVGSYCMDALAMALHTVWHSSSFKQVVIKNADMGGDCDTVGSIAGQIAGAFYGISSEMLELYSQMKDFKEEKYQVFLKAYKIATKSKLNDINI